MRVFATPASLWINGAAVFSGKVEIDSCLELTNTSVVVQTSGNFETLCLLKVPCGAVLSLNSGELCNFTAPDIDIDGSFDTSGTGAFTVRANMTNRGTTTLAAATTFSSEVSRTSMLHWSDGGTTISDTALNRCGAPADL